MNINNQYYYLINTCLFNDLDIIFGFYIIYLYFDSNYALRKGIQAQYTFIYWYNFIRSTIFQSAKICDINFLSYSIVDKTSKLIALSEFSVIITN